MKQAILLASICEFSGAVLMGSSGAGWGSVRLALRRAPMHTLAQLTPGGAQPRPTLMLKARFSACAACAAAVTETIRTGIAKLDAFHHSPDVLAYGMLCALLASGIWLLVATFWELPVSTTHAIGACRIAAALLPTAAACVAVWQCAAWCARAAGPPSMQHVMWPPTASMAPICSGLLPPHLTRLAAVGAIIGMTLVAVGPSAVLWSSNSNTFPFIGGVASL